MSSYRGNRPRTKTTPRTGPARNVQPHEHDPYRRQRKTKDAIICDGCGVVFHGGRWYRGAPPIGDERGGVCPACQRIRDRYPAGIIHLIGAPEELRDELVQMMRKVDHRERDEHPLERLIEIKDENGTLTATTTGMHLARRIAGALHRRFRQGVTIRYLDGDDLVRVSWDAADQPETKASRTRS